VPAGLGGLAGKDLWQRLERLRACPGTRSGLIPVRPELVAGVKFFGRYRGGWIRDGVLLSVGGSWLAASSRSARCGLRAW
jgi:hypothetical protein